MRLSEYINRYMSDVLEKRDALYDGNDSIFSYDAIDNNEAGNSVKVIYDSEGRIIELDDILHLHVSDFTKKYNFKSSLQAFEKYLSVYKIITGEDIILSYQRDIARSRERLKRLSSINTMDLLGVSV